MATAEFLPQCKLTPDMIWRKRWKALGGKSAVTGQPLPEELSKCNPGVQADHYDAACYAMAHYVLASLPTTYFDSSLLEAVPVPPGVSDQRAAEIRAECISQMLLDHGAG